MKIALFPNMIKKSSREVADNIVAFLKGKGAEIYSEDAV